MQKTISKILRNEFLQGGAFFFIASFIGSFINYLFNILVGRALGPKGFGEITTLFSYTAVFSVPMIVMSLVTIQKVGSKGKIAPEFALGLENWFIQKIKKWWIIILIPLLLTPVVPSFTNLSSITGYYLLPSIILSFIFNS